MENDYVTNEKLEATKVELLERIEKAETNLLTEFRKWARSFESRTRVTEFTVSALHERMGLIEDRVSELENPSPRQTLVEKHCGAIPRPSLHRAISASLQ